MLLSKPDAMKAVNKKRTEKIILRKPNLISDDGGGFKPADPTTKDKFINAGSEWANLKKPILKTEAIAGAISSVLLNDIDIRYRTDIKKGWQVLYGAKVFSVEHTYDYGRETTILVCKEVVK